MTAGYGYISRVDTRDFACIQRTGAFLTKKSWICYAYPGYELVKHKFGGSIPDTHDKTVISMCASPEVGAHDYSPHFARLMACVECEFLRGRGDTVY